jgi:NAD+ diphosphatase
MIVSPGFTGSRLDRADDARHDPERLASLRERPDARLLRLNELAPVIEGDALAWAPLTSHNGDTEIALLGRLDGLPSFVALTPGVSAFRRPPELFGIITRLRSEEAATYAAARSLVDWHARHRFCANCGIETAPIRAGWARACPACSAEHFPRTDPVVIMLAERGAGDTAEILIGRQHSFPAGRYSALAGFLEPGESIEEAVRREIAEESGVRTGAVRYIASQPWPFPSQLMIGCIATAESDEIIVDVNEIEHAMWVNRTDVAAALGGDPAAPFLPPPPYAIAHTLFQRWLAGA